MNDKTSEGEAPLPEISQPEFTVLRPLWKRAPLSVREVHDEVAPLTGWAYTTTKTVMDRMTAKRLLARQREDGTYTYVPLISRPAGLARMVRFFADRILETDRLSVVSMFKGKGVLTEDEVDELARLIEDDGRMGED